MKKTHTLLNRHQLLDPVALRNWLAHNLDPVARADQLLTLRPEELNCIFDTLSMPEGASLLASLPAECAGHLLLRLHGSIVGILQGTLARRDLLAILRRLDEHDRKTLLARLPEPARKAFQSLLAWPNESVGANMRHEYLAVEANATVESAKQLIHGAWDQARLFGHLYVVDGEQRLLGSVSLKSLLIADPLLPAGELMEGRRCASTPGRIRSWPPAC